MFFSSGIIVLSGSLSNRLRGKFWEFSVLRFTFVDEASKSYFNSFSVFHLKILHVMALTICNSISSSIFGVIGWLPPASWLVPSTQPPAARLARCSSLLFGCFQPAELDGVVVWLRRWSSAQRNSSLTLSPHEPGSGETRKFSEFQEPG